MSSQKKLKDSFLWKKEKNSIMTLNLSINHHLNNLIRTKKFINFINTLR